jgi:hypothetical protein
MILLPKVPWQVILDEKVVSVARANFHLYTCDQMEPFAIRYLDFFNSITIQIVEDHLQELDHVEDLVVWW